MKLYNTRTRKIEELKPLENHSVRIYSCGPTVYDHAHIGNLSAYVFADTLRRTIKMAGYEVTHAMNYTDVDDKTIRRSREQYPEAEPKAALRMLTDTYIKLFLEDMANIGNDTSALTFLRATDPAVIAGMQKLIRELLWNGFAYTADDSIYFSIEAYQRSGKIYGQLLKLTVGNTSAERIQNDEYDKESVHDFALWKKQREGEPAWEFQLPSHDMTGRPGWHIECSVMSRQVLGQPFDIHTGGIDLIFPHHENEIAQSTALEANPVMATFFAHNAHLYVDGRKMAKSAKNFYTLQDIIEHGFDPLAFRLLVLQGHYRSEINFSWTNLEAAQNRLKDLCALSALRYQALPLHDSAPSRDFTGRIAKIKAAMENDLRTPEVFSIIFSDAEEDKAKKATSNNLMGGIFQNELEAFTSYLQILDDYLGLALMSVDDIDEDHKRLIAARNKARKQHDWNTSDELRSQLENEGIGLRDTPNGTLWFWNS